MKATELRIGNYVKDPYNETIRLTSVEKDASMLRPIPLTEEWLERFGFEQMKLYTGDNCFVKEKFCVLCDGQLKNYDLRLTFDSDQTIRVKLDYVHQLQNLYFSLTGQELNQNKDE